MAVDTEIQGSPVQIDSAANWFETTFATQVRSAADVANDQRRRSEDAWQGPAGDGFRGTATKLRQSGDQLDGAAKKMGRDLEAFASSLRTCQSDMASVRSTASLNGLVVDGFIVQDPGPGPARPPDDFVGTEAEVAVHNQRVADYDAHQDKIRAYNAAEAEAARIDLKYEAACRTLQSQYTPGEHAAWILNLGQAVGEGAAAAVAASIARRVTGLRGRADDLLAQANRYRQELRNNPRRFNRLTLRFPFSGGKWRSPFFEIDPARFRAAYQPVLDMRNEASRLAAEADRLAASRLPSGLGVAGRALGPIGLGLGVYNDFQAGEPPVQVVASQGGGFLAGVGAGAATGALVGSVVPGAGTAVGAVAGAVVGAGASIFADGAIDSFFENGPDVGRAVQEGWNSITGTGEAIADGVGGVGRAITGLFD